MAAALSHPTPPREAEEKDEEDDDFPTHLRLSFLTDYRALISLLQPATFASTPGAEKRVADIVSTFRLPTPLSCAHPPLAPDVD